MEKHEIFICIKQKLQSLGVPENKITESAQLNRDLSLDPVDEDDVRAYCERLCHVHVPKDVVKNCVTLGDWVTVLYNKVS